MQKAITLYEISKEMYDLGEILLENEGELTTKYDEKELEVNNLLAKKTDSVTQWRQQQKDTISAIDERLSQLTKLKSNINNALTNLDRYVISCMQKMDKKTIEGRFDRITLPKQRNIVLVKDENAIPVEYIRVKEYVTFKKTEMKEALDQNIEIPGVELGQGKQSVKYTIRSTR